MRVLIATSDIYGKPGGGETFFRGLIEKNTGIDFCFFRWSGETIEDQLPDNATPIALQGSYRERCGDFALHNFILALPNVAMSQEADRIALILDMAASVAGQSFDVLEIPDYLVHGWLLPAAIRHFGGRIGKVVLSMHGTISDAMRDNWAGDEPADMTVLERTESFLYRLCDIRYGIGERYIGSWQATEGLPAQLLGHQHVFDYGRYTRGRLFKPNPQEKLPDLAFVGRQDKWKGPDLFIDLCAQIPKKDYRFVHLYGSSTEIGGQSSIAHLTNLANNRALKFHSNRTVPYALLQEFFASRSMITILPSRRDTFNLVSVESLLNGCPTVLSTQAGAVEFLDKAFPGIPFTRLDVRDMPASFAELRDLCRHYDDHREALRSYLADREPEAYGQPLAEIYQVPSTADATATELADRLADDLLRHIHDRILPAADESRRSSFRDHAQHVRGWSEYSMGNEAFETAWDISGLLGRLTAELRMDGGPDRIRAMPEDTETLVRALVPVISAADRARVFHLMAYLEKHRGNDLLHATYLLRHMRLTGRTDEAELQAVERILREANLPEEAVAARLINTRDHEGIYDYLSARPAPDPLIEESGIVERIDRRTNTTVKGSVIVSVYNGAPKMRRFLQLLDQMTEAARAVTEVIFVDSNSVDNTRDALITALEDLGGGQRPGLSVLYLRSEKRETIQKAWNRGITAARGEALTFLGVDEAMRADAMEQFIETLERRPDIDWVQGNALVTEVDDHGTFLRDIFPHRRSAEGQNAQYLECCYMGFVGAAYRRNVHSRFGLYDPRFRAAGDNEFKNRILPFIKVKTLPEVLGTFLNYPEVRTTESPVAELEDLRAWYIHRTQAGIRYAFERQSDEDCVAQYHRSLRYRRSFLDFESTDLEYAHELGEYLLHHRPEAYRQIQRLHSGTRTVLDGYRGLDEVLPAWLPRSLEELSRRHAQISTSFEQVAHGFLTQKHRGLTNGYWYRNDNRNQQHYFHWPSMQRQFDLGRPLGWSDLAGAQDMAEVMSACRCEAEFADYERGGRSGNTKQLTMLMSEPVLHAVVPTTTEAGCEAALAGLLKAVADMGQRFILAVTGPFKPELRERAPDGVCFTGRVGTWRPLLTAAKMAVIPAFDEASGQALFGYFVQAMGHGRPAVVGSGILAALKKRGVAVDLTGIPVVDNPLDALAAIDRLRDDPKALAAMADKAIGVGQALHAAGVITGQRPVQSEVRVRWCVEIHEINQALHLCFEERPGAAAALQKLEARYTSNPTIRKMVEEVVGALLVDKSAPILQTDQYMFRRIRLYRRLPSVEAAMAVVRALTIGNPLVPARAFVEHRIAAVQLDRRGTPLDEWRRGNPPSRTGGKGRIVVLADPAGSQDDAFLDLLRNGVIPAARQMDAELVLSGASMNGHAPDNCRTAASPAELKAALGDATAVVCLGVATPGSGPVALGTVLTAAMSGLPMVGNRKAFIHLGMPPGFSSPWITDDPDQLRAQLVSLASSPDTAARNRAEMGRLLSATAGALA